MTKTIYSCAGFSAACLSFAMLIGTVSTGAAQPACTDTTFPIEDLDVRPIAHVDNDSEMYGNNPNINIYARIERESQNALFVTGAVTMRENGGDSSLFQSKFRRQIVVPALNMPECRFVGTSQSEGRLDADAGNGNVEPTTYPGNGLIKEAQCLADTKGDDAGKLYCLIRFNQVVVRLAPAQ